MLSLTRTFEFLDIPNRTEKPRTLGLTTLADFGSPNSAVEGTLELWHDIIDVVKVSAFLLTADDEAVREKIAIYKRWGIDAQMGGPILEVARLQHKERETLERMRDMGYASLEISAEALPSRPAIEEERAFAELAQSYGFSLHGEVGKKFPSGDDLRKGDDHLDVDQAVKVINEYLALGCDFVYFEGHLLRAIIGDNAEFAPERGWQIEQMVERIGLEKIVFEVPFTYLSYSSKRILQHWLVNTFGPNVGVGNVELNQISELEVIRAGMFPVFDALNGDHPFIHELAAKVGQ
jgi:phosphosulfolactate synthase